MFCIISIRSILSWFDESSSIVHVKAFNVIFNHQVLTQGILSHPVVTWDWIKSRVFIKSVFSNKFQLIILGVGT